MQLDFVEEPRATCCTKTNDYHSTLPDTLPEHAAKQRTELKMRFIVMTGIQVATSEPCTKGVQNAAAQAVQ